jgi:hypothetical protein
MVEKKIMKFQRNKEICYYSLEVGLVGNMKYFSSPSKIPVLEGRFLQKFNIILKKVIPKSEFGN